MGKQLFANNATSTMSGTLASGGSTFTLASGTGSRFPAIAEAGDYFEVTVYTKDEYGVWTNIETMKITNRVADTLTIGERDFSGQLGDPAGLAYDGLTGTVYVEMLWTAESAIGLQEYTDDSTVEKLTAAATEKTTPVNADLIPLVDSAYSNALKKLSWQNVKAGIWSAFGALVNGGTAKTTPVDADMIGIADSADSNSSKKVTLVNLWTNLFKGKADALYTPIAKGVTNGDSHDHNGGDGAQIAYSSLSGLPSLNFDPAGTAASAISTHVGQSDPHTQYAPKSSVREQLTANRTYYVRTDGNDSNDGLTDSSGGAFLTIQKAVDVVAGLDCGIYTGTIQVADGTYNQSVELKTCVYSGHRPRLYGNITTPGNCVINATSTIACIHTSAESAWDIGGFKLTSTGGVTRCIRGAGQAKLFVTQPIDFGSSAGGHIGATERAFIRIATNWTISGNPGNFHIDVNGGGTLMVGLVTCTLSGTVNFPTAFVGCRETGLATIQLVTFSGSATGKRYDVTLNSVINTFGAGATYLPGNVAGTTATGGQYA